MLPVWGDPLPGECGHGERALTCRACRDQATRDYADLLTSPAALVAAVVLLVALLVSMPDASRREAAFAARQLQEHQQRLEAARPGALARLRELAAAVTAAR